MTNEKGAMTVSIGKYVEEFGKEFYYGIDAIKRAAKIYATALLKHPTLAQKKFEEAYPNVNKRSWDALEKIGNGDLNANAFMLPYSVADKIAKLPIAKQNKMLDVHNDGFRVLNPKTLKAMVVPVSMLSCSQASILFDEKNGRVRSIDEQRKIVASRFESFGSGKKVHTPKYVIVGNVCIINGVEVGKATLKNIIKEMEKNECE